MRDIHDVGDEVLADVVATCAQEPYGFGGEAMAVPCRCHAAGDAADLGRAHDKTVVVELVTETDPVCAIGVEGEINDGALRA